MKCLLNLTHTRNSKKLSRLHSHLYTNIKVNRKKKKKKLACPFYRPLPAPTDVKKTNPPDIRKLGKQKSAKMNELSFSPLDLTPVVTVGSTLMST